jgi:hypothetical protein
MGEFFKPRRRKIGVILLMMACAFVAIWIRGHLVEDLLDRRTGRVTEDYFMSSKFGVSWCRYHIEGMGGSTDQWKWQSEELEDGDDLDYAIRLWRQAGSRHWQFLGFHAAAGRDLEYPPAPKFVIWTVPYGFLIIPFTLLSSYLLLTKPRKSTQMKTVDHISNEGT